MIAKNNHNNRKRKVLSPNNQLTLYKPIYDNAYLLTPK